METLRRERRKIATMRRFSLLLNCISLLQDLQENHFCKDAIPFVTIERILQVGFQSIIYAHCHTVAITCFVMWKKCKIIRDYTQFVKLSKP